MFSSHLKKQHDREDIENPKVQRALNWLQDLPLISIQGYGCNHCPEVKRKLSEYERYVHTLVYEALNQHLSNDLYYPRHLKKIHHHSRILSDMIIMAYGRYTVFRQSRLAYYRVPSLSGALERDYRLNIAFII